MRQAHARKSFDAYLAAPRRSERAHLRVVEDPEAATADLRDATAGADLRESTPGSGLRDAMAGADVRDALAGADLRAPSRRRITEAGPSQRRRRRAQEAAQVQVPPPA